MLAHSQGAFSEVSAANSRWLQAREGMAECERMLRSLERYLQAIFPLAESGEEPANQISPLMERDEERKGDDGVCVKQQL